MPLPADVTSGTDRGFRRLLGRWRRPPDAAEPPEQVLFEPQAPVRVDASTHAFWRSPGTARERIAELVAAHEQGDDARGQRPRGNPAFSEALFVELMRAHQYRRAFDLLAGDCRRSWGSAEAFAEAQGASAMRRLRGVRVKDIRYLPEWTDPQRGTRYEHVAELDVEYSVGDGAGVTVPRVVHLVPDEGKWRSLCFPA